MYISYSWFLPRLITPPGIILCNRYYFVYNILCNVCNITALMLCLLHPRGAGNFLYMAYYGCACRIAPFFSIARYMIFNKKYMNDRIFLDSYVKGPIFLTSWYLHIFFAQRFFEAAYPLGIT